MSSYMVNLRKISIWSNLLSMLLRERIWCARLRRRYIVLSKVCEPSLISLACTISEVGFEKCYSDHRVFIRKSSSGIMIFVIYVDIQLVGSDSDGIRKAKKYLKTQFVTKNIGKPRYFLGLKLLTVNMWFFIKGSMLWIYYKKLDYLATSNFTPRDVDLWDETEPYLRIFLSTGDSYVNLSITLLQDHILPMLLDW